VLLIVNALCELVAAVVVGATVATTVVDGGSVVVVGGGVVVVGAASTVIEAIRADNARYDESLDRDRLNTHEPGDTGVTVRRPFPRVDETVHTDGVDDAHSTSVVTPALPSCCASARTVTSAPTVRLFEGNSQVFHAKSYRLVGQTLKVRDTFEAAWYWVLPD
jgi:hypothetical protein